MPHNLLSNRLWALIPEELTQFLSHVRTGQEQKAQADTPMPQHMAHMAAIKDGQTRSDKPRPYAVVDGVAIITIKGVLAQYSSWYTVGMLDYVHSCLALAYEDKGVGAVLLDITSPGGTVVGMKETADYIANLRASGEKPIAAYANGTMASAAYLIGSATGRIYAPATANVGSIGIISVYEDWSKWNDKFGVAYTCLTAGKWKAVGNPNNPISDNEKSYLQGQLETLYGHFTKDVSAHMGLDLSDVTTWADGQIFIASKAPQGLVTAIVTDRDAAIQTLLKEIHMDKATLASQHPELLASIERDAVASAQSFMEEQAKANLASAHSACLAAVKAMAGAEVATRVEALLSQGLSASQIEAVANMMGGVSGNIGNADSANGQASQNVQAPQADTTGTTGKANVEQRILEALSNGHSTPLAGMNTAASKNPETPAAFGQRMADLLK